MFAVGIGALAIVARHVGAREPHVAEDVLFHAVVAAVVLQLLVVPPVLVFAPRLVAMFGVQPDVVGEGTVFLRRLVLGLPSEAVVFVLALALRAAGDMRTPLVIGAVIGIVNVAANWVLIFGRFGVPALGIAGSGLGTAIAFTTGAALGLVWLIRGGLRLRLPRRLTSFRMDVVRRILAVGYPAALEHVMMQVGFFLYMSFAAAYGTTAVAAYIIGVRILAMSFLPGFGFSAAAGTLVGQNLGAGRPGDAARAGWAANRLAVGLMSAGGAVVFVLARPIARLFVADPVVVDEAVAFIRVLGAAQPLMAIDFTLGGALRGAGDTRFPLVAVVLGFYGCRLGMALAVAWVLRLDLLWLWLAVVGDYLVRAGLKAWRFRSMRWARAVV
jgi:putative MATE family efflux protein